jgi:hypothetical protein
MKSLIVMVSLACVLAATGSAAPSRQPSSILVLGTATAAGYGSDPRHPYSTAPENSWATGTNPAVKSVYARLLALNPAINGNDFTLATDGNPGAELDDLAGQVERAASITPRPGLVLIEVVDRNVKCDGATENDVAAYGSKFTASLDTLTRALPNARILVVSQWGSLSSYAAYLKTLPLGARLKHGGNSPCQLVESPSGNVSPARIAYNAKVVKAEQTQLRAACAKHPQCHYDGGALQRVALTPADVSLGQFSPTIQGQARLAAAEWPVVARMIGL